MEYLTLFYLIPVYQVIGRSPEEKVVLRGVMRRLPSPDAVAFARNRVESLQTFTRRSHSVTYPCLDKDVVRVTTFCDEINSFHGVVF